MTMNFLSILLSIAMMLTGAAGLDADVPMASSLTIRDIYFNYNDVSFDLTPSLTAGVMTENGTAIFDLSMQCGEASLFPMQLAINEEAATLVVEKTGQAFTMDAETINAVLAEALDLDSLAMDAETTQAFELLAESFETGFTAGYASVDEEALNAQVAEMLTPVETSAGTASYNDVEYEVTINRYALDNDQTFELIEAVYTSNEQLSELYNDLLDTLNETLAAEAVEGEAVVEITSMKDLYAQLGMTITLDIVESVSADGAFSQATGAYTITYAELPEPFVVNMDIYEVNGVTDVLVETNYTIEDMQLNMGVVEYIDETEQYFEMLLELLPVESDDLTEEDYENAVSFYMTAATTPDEDGGTDYGFVMEGYTYDAGVSFVVDGIMDAEGNTTSNISFDFADSEDTISCGLTLDYSNAVFANAAEGLEAIAVDPENLAAVEAEFQPVMESLMVDLQTLIEDESVTEMISAFTAINTATYEVSAEEVTTVEVAESEADYEEAVPANTELTFNEPEFTYIPEGLTIQDSQVDVEYNSVSYTIADEDYSNVFYVYAYGDTYGISTESYALSADGALTAVEDRIISVETDEDAIYAEMTDGDLYIGVSYYGTEMGLEDIAKILSGMVY